MSSELPGGFPLEPDILALLERERSDPYGDGGEVAKAARARRLEHAALALAVTGVAPLLGPAAEAARAALASSVRAQVKSVVAWGLAWKIGAGAVLVAAGGLAGALIEARYGAPAPRPVSVSSTPAVGASPPYAVPPSGESAPTLPAIPAVDIDSLPVAAPSAASGRPLSQPTASAGAATGAHPAVASTREERLLLDTARAAVTRGAYSAALDSLREDAERFPQGKLGEERELLFVQALAGAGRDAEAAARANAFEARFPRSIFLPAVRAASSNKEP